MPRRDGRHAGGLVYRWGPVLLVLCVLGAAAASYRYDLGERWLGIAQTAPADPVDNPAAVEPPAGLDLPEPGPAAPVAVPLPDTTALSTARVRAGLAKDLADPDLGRHIVALVEPLSGGAETYRSGTGTFTPASTLKLLTSAAALEALGPGTTFSTRVVTGSSAHRIVLVGGGDPYLSSQPLTPAEQAVVYPSTRADVVTLARRTAAALAARGVTRVRVGYDDSLFSGPAASPWWEPGYLPDGVVSPISALWVDRGANPSGYGRVADPSRTAADTFSAALSRAGKKAGLRVQGQPAPAAAGATATDLASVESAPLDQIVQQVLTVSDNEGAEVLLRQTGLAVSGKGSFTGGTSAVRQTLQLLGVPMVGAVLHDGSGLSRHDKLSPETLTAVLRLAAAPEHPELSALLEGLPVAGFTGSLTDRFDQGSPAGRGRVRAKTGTLTQSGVHSLAGIAVDLDGHVMAFVLAADRVRVPDALAARVALDRAASRLGACHCGPPA